MKVDVHVLGSLASNSPYGLCGRKARLNLNMSGSELCESRGERPGIPASNSP